MREIALLPNRDGFEFIAVLNTGEKVKSKVYRDENGLHCFVEYSNTIGWLPLN